MKHLKSVTIERPAKANANNPLKSLLWLLVLGSVSEKQRN